MRAKRLTGALVVLLATAAAVLPIPPTLVESWYSRVVYPAIQVRLTGASNVIPIAVLDVAVGMLILVTTIVFVRSGRSRGLVRTTVLAVRQGLVFVAFVYLLFLVVWGLNYRRVPIEQKLDYDESRVTPDAARRLAEAAVKQVNLLHEGAHRSRPSESALPPAFESAQRQLGVERLALPGRPKRSVLEPYFRIAAIDGMTDPLFLEIILNPDLLPVERPFVMAHEWGHLAGFADESEANLVAWLTCLAGGPLAQYSGWLTIYSHVAAVLPPSDRRRIAGQLDAAPRQDLEAIGARVARSAPVVRTIARESYDAYLKANRIEEGIASYDLVVRLILAAGAENGWAPRVHGRPASAARALQ